ncbi:transcription regulator [Zea mays]|uniref:Transcription regulator n=1 Tax=Zea mays TaxID=4577 RepID=A0A1D6PM95_MAIZE|nr:transcription regulator [Zea mays]
MIPVSADIPVELRFLLECATGSNFDSIRLELCQLVDSGLDGCILVLRVCLNQMLLNAGEVKNLQLQQKLLSDVFRYCLHKTCFTTSFCEALATIALTDDFLESLTNLLELSVAEKIGVGLALSDSEDSEMKQKGQWFSIAQIEKLCTSHIQSLSNGQIHEIVMFLHQSDGLSKHMDTFNNIISLLKVTERPFFVPVTNGDFDSQANPSRHLEMYFGSTNDDFESLLSEIGKEISMADIVAELGYGFTVDSTHCKEILSIVEPLDDIAISKLLGAVVGTHIGLGEAHNTYATFVSAIRNSHTNDSPQPTKWNTDVLVDSINELAPSTNWVRVIEYLDHEGFNIPDEASFYLLMSIYECACKDPFPLHAVCGSLWENTEGQISFLKHAVCAPSDKFTFAHSSRHLAFQDLAGPSQGNHAWFCLDLLEVLCQLAEVGYTASVRSMLEYPLGHCPELLLVGVSHISTVYNLLQNEVLSCVFPALLKDPTKRNVVNYLWHTNSYLTLQGFVDAHNDPDCLLRIVDVCHDLKILSTVLDSTPFAFSIKLAAASLRKDYSNLEKWLTEKLSLYGKGFVEECVNFLKATMSNTDYVLEGTTQPQSIVRNIYWESSYAFIKVLQSHSGQLLSDAILDEIRKLCVSFESRNPSSAVRELANSDGGSDDIEVEANAYFQHMFSGQISVDSMIQMLGRFKESTDKRQSLHKMLQRLDGNREVSIFNCMISNLFKEYTFFPKYPDKQLKIAAVLFGSLIKHQLVAHSELGIALRGVRDALRKPVDSKMFMFGTSALEQFMDRVIEWPRYCNYILQISHLRGTHLEMVSVIERALAKISSSQNEPNVGNLLSAEQHVSGSSSMEGIEASESSWLMGTIPSQLGRPLSSPLQHRQQGLLSERSEVSMNSLNKSNLSSQPPLASSSADLTINSKTTAPPSLLASPHQSISVSTSVHVGFLRSRSTPGLPRQPSYTTGFGTALNIETLVAAAEQRDIPIETPPPEVQDKILFMINNISISNMEAKAKEFNEVIQEQHYPWFAQYMVMKRASIEPNFHDLYLKFFDKLNSKSLNKEMLKATYENCKVLLRSDLIKSSSEERSLLKNLGSWLGKFTIGRNQALRAKEIDPKSLIVEAYEKGLMIAVIPFTSKILEPCQSSIAYRPPNPWTIGILSLLAEIYNLPNLKMNLKFDIEVLFKNLTVDMKDVKPTSLLKDRLREVEGNPDFSNKDVTTSQTPVVPEVLPGTIPSSTHVELQPEINITSRAMSLPNILNQYVAPVRLPTNSTVEADKVALMMPEQVSSLTQVLPAQTQSPSPSPFSVNQLMAAIPRDEICFKINPKLGSIGPQLQYSKIMDLALDKANREIILPVIQRSVTIASRTTKELILKDYALESDNNMITRSAHLMVGTLAGSLAHVTCKEPLRVALYSNLRNLIQNLMSGSETIEQIIHMLVNDNLDLGCAIIEAVATRQRSRSGLVDDMSVEAVHQELVEGGSVDAPALPIVSVEEREAPGHPPDLGSVDALALPEISVAELEAPGHPPVLALDLAEDLGVSCQEDWSSHVVISPAGPCLDNPLVGDLMSGLAEAVTAGQHGSGFSYLLTDGVSANVEEAVTAGQHGSGVSQLVAVGSPAVVSARAVELIDAEIAQSFSQQRKQREGGGPTYHETFAYAQGPFARVPEALSSKPGHLSASQQRVYEDFVHVWHPHNQNVGATGSGLSGVATVSSTLGVLRAYSPNSTSASSSNLSTVHMGGLTCITQPTELGSEDTVIAQFLSNPAQVGPSESPVLFSGTVGAASTFSPLASNDLPVSLEALIANDGKHVEIQSVIAEVPDMLRRCVSRDEAALVVAQKVFKSLYDNASNSAYVSWLLATLIAIRDVCKLVVKELTSWVIYSDEEKKFNIEIIFGLIHSKLLNLGEYNVHLTKLIDGGRNKVATEFAMSLVQTLITQDPVSISELHNVVDAISKVLAAQVNKEESIANETTLIDPNQVAVLFSEWCQICSHVNASDAIYSRFVTQLEQDSLLNGDDISERFFHILTELAVTHSLVSEQIVAPGGSSQQSPQQPHISYFSIDSYAKLVVMVLKIISVTVRTIQKDAEEKKASFNPRPYFRLFINWLYDLTTTDGHHDGSNFQVLTAFANAFHLLQPLRVPAWSFAWLELVSHRSFMPKLLMSNSQKGWPFFQRLLVALFKFMEPYLRNAELPEAVDLLYKGTMRVLLVLLHDFPEFICDYHFSFCDVIPSSCIQMRNVILSAFPRNMRLPDPSTPNLKIDLLAEISIAPRIMSDVDGTLKSKQLKTEFDEYLKRPEGSSFLSVLKQNLLLPQNEAAVAGTRYNVPLINSLVLYVGIQAVQQLQQNKANASASVQQIKHTPTMDSFQIETATEMFTNLITSFDTEGRYLLLNAIANQLRYPNSHTHYYSFIILHLFAEATQEIIQEQITRVLLERLIVNRPHPWGLLITSIELIKNPRYNFWNRSFTHSAPEIEKLFESVARSCGAKAVDEGISVQDGSH